MGVNGSSDLVGHTNAPRFRAIGDERLISATEFESLKASLLNQRNHDAVWYPDGSSIQITKAFDEDARFWVGFIYLSESASEVVKWLKLAPMNKNFVPDKYLLVGADGSLTAIWSDLDEKGARLYKTMTLSAESDLVAMGAGRDYVLGTVGADDIHVSPGGLNAGDYIDGRGGDNTLVLDGPATLDITLPQVFEKIDHIRLSDGDDTLVVTQERLNGVETIDGGGGFDTLRLKEPGIVEFISHRLSGIERVLGTDGDDKIYAADENDTIDGGGGNDVLDGGSGDDVLSGGSGNDRLEGGAGADRMAGGMGNDTYVVDNPADTVTEAAGEGDDTVRTAISYTLSANVENLVLEGDRKLTGAGNDLDNMIFANNAGNTLYGYAGRDQLVGGKGQDLLDGGAGADIMQGGDGADTYIVDDARDMVDETGGQNWIDTIRARIDIDLNARTIIGDVENVILEGAGNLSATGNSLANRLTGNEFANRLDGGAGADYLAGGGGNDTYVLDNVGDIVDEEGAGGLDSIESSVNVDLNGSNIKGSIENVTLLGALHLTAFGNQLDNVLIGNEGDNILDGREGADLMRGGAGNDIYYVDDARDRVDETGGAGNDRVISRVSLDLSADFGLSQVENLLLTALSEINGRGNALNNAIAGNDAANSIYGAAGNDELVGNGGNDRLYGEDGDDGVSGGDGDDVVDGGSGNDRLYGGSGSDSLNGGSGGDSMSGDGGSDTYYVDSALDRVIENDFSAAGGTDTVYSAVSYILNNVDAGAVENLVLTGTALNGTGNGIDNTITGNAYGNTLDGGAGADVMIGGAGNDVYVVDNLRDLVNEQANAGAGTDTVYASVNFNMNATSQVLGLVENLVLTGSAVRGDGNASGNVMTGNSMANQLFGWAGDDVINGGAGYDTLTGGAGRDSFLFSADVGRYDVITDFSVADDTIRLDHNVFSALGQSSGWLRSDAFTISTVSAAADAGDRIIYDRDSGYLYYDVNGTGGGGLNCFAKIAPYLALTAADFLIV
ncbi:calcium-binding protein [Gellertiella hungarica]|uniref:Ca2+-binding RTX toxin-like protein n=1 Tax=Gellertiella hungarica TaxID=1572859 RepID=A0A7W6J2J4_9HYPH|nr:calcium-binding protein [Gellertiella hungarica]MBB4063601.1 Ca2+-binding RTX toxin-like protein [Gellertiella hungarica]